MIPSRAARPSTQPIDGEERWQIAKRLLTDDTIDPADRVAGALVVIYGQPISRIVTLTTAHVEVAEGNVFLQLGHHPLDLPEPLATLIQELPARRRDGAAAHLPNTWLFAGSHAGAPLTANSLAIRLQKIGIDPRRMRVAATDQLARELAPVSWPKSSASATAQPHEPSPAPAETGPATPPTATARTHSGTSDIPTLPATTAASICSTGTCTWRPRGPTRVVAWVASQLMISSAAAICAASYASAISGCSAAASDQVFGPLTVTSTNRTPLSSARNRPFAAPVSTSNPGDPLFVGRAVQAGSMLDGLRGGDDSHGDAAAFGEVVVVSAGAVGLDVVPGCGSCAAVDLHPAMHPNHLRSPVPTRPSTTNEGPRNAAWAARHRATHLRPS